MSADVWLVIDTGGEEAAVVSETRNVTYNLTAMLLAAGFPGHRAMEGAPASEAGGVYKFVADRLRADPAKYREMNPSNGWGSYEGAIEFCDLMATDCSDHPKATIGGWL
jgi:hypothetical protein